MKLEWMRDLDEALASGRSERKAVFLYFAKDP
jgi:hypothetical protein